ncbi:MAG: RNA 2',3'-cyclic phosphodiesterase [Chloroflexota bacterium]|nr:MAG: RNA 2',3'-cyclic phosphodiesterase [Chloroflexota bacterium]
MPRLFVAIDLPETVKDALGELCRGIPGAKWVSREQMHLTLRFIGEVDAPRFEAIRSGLGHLQAAPFELALKGVGQFPPRGAPRVLWVGLAAPPALAALQQRVESALVGLGIEPEDRPFSPHITLARLKTPPPPLLVGQFLNKHAAFQSESIPVSAFILYSSQLRPTGPVYRQEAVYNLKAES